MRILVTGGAGLIGTSLTRALTSQGHDVLVLDNLYSGSIENIEEFSNLPNFQFLEKDVSDPLSVECDFIFNLACPASPVYYQKDPVGTVKTNVLGSIQVLELARINECPVLQASTSEVYGDPTVSPQSENYLGNVNPIGIRACYDEGKRVAETLFFDYHRQHHVDIRVVRIFNTYGPGMRLDDGRVISNFIRQALNGEDLTVYGTGRQTRSFCFVDDLTEALVKVMGSDNSAIGPINLGNPEEYSMIEIAENILNLTKSSSKIRFEKLPMDDPQQRRPDISKAERILNWKPQTTLENGLIQTIADFQKRIKNG